MERQPEPPLRRCLRLRPRPLRHAQEATRTRAQGQTREAELLCPDLERAEGSRSRRNAEIGAITEPRGMPGAGPRPTSIRYESDAPGKADTAVKPPHPLFNNWFSASAAPREPTVRSPPAKRQALQNQKRASTSSTVSMSASVWSALTWKRISSSPRGTTG